MSDSGLDVEIVFSEANFNSHLEKGTIEMSNKYFDLLQDKMIRLINENLELHKYLGDKIMSEMELKDKLKEEREKVSEYSYKLSNFRCEETYENQQKAFIEWLEDKLNMCDGFLDTIKSDLEGGPYAGRVSRKKYIATQIMKNETGKKIYQEILSKYKEIVGDKDE